MPAPTATPTPTPTATPAAAPNDASASASTATPTPTPTAQTQGSAVYSHVVNADQLWSQGTTGRGVTVAVLDSGVAADPDLVQPANRILASVNFADQRLVSDPGGHGTHVAGIVAGNGGRSDGQFVGVAPEANIVDVRVLSSTGSGRISSVVRGIEWVLAHQATYNIRVLNLSFGAPASTSYRTDPMSAAVEIAWRRGLVVVVAAGNGGPARGTVASPGIDPYAITVGATDDQGTISPRDDTLAPFSSWGSADSNAKPDLVAPGRRIVSLRVPGSALDRLFADRVVTASTGATYIRMSGTSMATPVVSGAVALLLQRRPSLTPDQVKAILVASTQPYGQDTGVALPDPVRLADLVGYEVERQPAVDNTRQFVANLPANNVLLYGDRGTGKSSTVKALLTEFQDKGLRLIEVSKEHLGDYVQIVTPLRGRRERFILFVDDLSFEEHETQYKALKAVLEGGLEARPENVVLYATSNRRRLVRERFSDRTGRVSGDDDVHTEETVQEKLSLADRFGIHVPFLIPDQDRYLAIAAALAARLGVRLPAREVRRRALLWSQWHNGLSCRTARQFVEALRGELALAQADGKRAPRHAGHPGRPAGRRPLR